MMGKTPAFIDYVISCKVDKCVLWPHGRDSYGYGRAKYKGHTTRLAHRIVCEKAHGPAPDKRSLALHSCGNGHLGCVNPKHLYWGDQEQNSRDSIKHGTMSNGERSGVSKLTRDNVVKIRDLSKSGVSQRGIGAIFGVTGGTIQAILENRTWKHVV